MAFTIEQISSISDWSQKIAIFAALISLISMCVSYETGRRESKFQDLKMAYVESSAKKAEEDLAKIKAPRKLSMEYKTVLQILLGDFKGTKFTGTVTYSASDSMPLWQDIAQVLIAAGWVNISKGEQFGEPPATITPFPRSGVFIIVHPNSQARFDRQTEILVRALKEAGIHAERSSVNVNPKEDPEVIYIEIGTRPL